MRLLIILLFFTTFSVFCQESSILPSKSEVVYLDSLITEAIQLNQEIRSSDLKWKIQIARIPQTSSLDAPSIEYMHEGFTGLKVSEPMYNRFKFMQMIPFPGKLSGEQSVGEIQAKRAYKDHLETISSVIANLKGAYAELWYIQQTIILLRENIQLMNQIAEITLTNYSVGKTLQQDVLKTGIELAKMENELSGYQSREPGIKAMLMSILNREPNDTLGTAVLPDTLQEIPPLSLLLQKALESRQMLQSDSLEIVENEAMYTLSRKDYLPDFTFSVEHLSSPMTGFQGWSVSAGITLPFIPWSRNKAASQIEESELGIQKARAMYASSKTMVLASTRDRYSQLQSLRHQLKQYQSSILPQARQVMQSSLSLYKSGAMDYLMVLDSFRSLTQLRMESIMLRMQFEQAQSQFEQITGIHDLSLAQ